VGIHLFGYSNQLLVLELKGSIPIFLKYDNVVFVGVFLDFKSLPASGLLSQLAYCITGQILTCKNIGSLKNHCADADIKTSAQSPHHPDTYIKKVKNSCEKYHSGEIITSVYENYVYCTKCP